MTDNRRPSVGVAALIWRDGKILLYERAGSHGHGTWSIPGGHLEYGESWEECIRREVMEEIGVTLKNVRFLAVTNDIFARDDKHYVSIWMEADLDEGEPRCMEPEKIIRLAWSDLKDLPEPLFQPCWDNLRALKPELFA